MAWDRAWTSLRQVRMYDAHPVELCRASCINVTLIRHHGGAKRQGPGWYNRGERERAIDKMNARADMTKENTESSDSRARETKYKVRNRLQARKQIPAAGKQVSAALLERWKYNTGKSGVHSHTVE